MRHAKIVCTLGPATRSYERICQLIQAGMDVARLNFSHGTQAEHHETFEHVRRASRLLGKPVAVLADLSGPKIRLGEITGNEVVIERGQLITLTPEPVQGTADRVTTTYVQLAEDVHPGTRIFADDGRLEFMVREVVGRDVRCEVRVGGPLRSRKGLNIPDAHLSTPAVTEKDAHDMAFCRRMGVDYFALSFVRTAGDVIEAKRLAGTVPVIAKIEKPGAIEHLEAIADASDGLMVARGDLGIEVGYEKVPLLQKRLIRAMNQRAKPVITATQMLESMVESPQPTRAEVSDVANALLDGSDALMLSAETAAGRYPAECVRTMDRIIREVEGSAVAADMLHAPAKMREPTFRSAIAHSAARAAIELDLRAVAVYTETGRSAALVSAYRPHAPIVGFSRQAEVVPRMALYWGVTPFFAEHAPDVPTIIEQTERTLCEHGLAGPGQQIAITFGLDECGPLGTSTMKLWTIRERPE